MRSSTTLLGALAAVSLSAIVVASTRHSANDPKPPPVTEQPTVHVDPPAYLAPAPPSPARSWVSERVIDGPPVSLTASDGSGLTLASLRADAVVEGPLAFTEMRLAFDNPENRVREGTFKIVLPQGASVGRFAMKIDGAWQEGEVVPKARARVAYEDALHRKQDPALMEKGAGNEFTARVFPIPAHGRKEIILSYAQELTAGAPYALPLRGLPQLGALDVSVTGLGAAGSPQSLHRERFMPTEDFVADGASRAIAALRSGDLVVARVRPVPEAMPDPVTSAIVLVDTSASRALGLESELHAVKEMMHELASRQAAPVTVTVAAFDQEVARIYRGDAASFGDAEIAKIIERRALGASNLERALAWARDEAKAASATRVVLVTDGVATAGEEDASKLALAAASLREGGATRLDVVAVGGIRDDATARKLVTAGLAHDGVVADASDGVETIVRRLESGTKSDVAVAVEGAKWSYPTHLEGVQPGDEALVYAEVPEGAKLRVKIGGDAPVEIDASKGDRPLVERAWAQAKIASLESEERDHGKSADLEQRIIALSTKHRVLSEYTALLVLETDADYARFDFDRRALADILTVQDGQLAWWKRGAREGTALAKNGREDDHDDKSGDDNKRKGLADLPVEKKPSDTVAQTRSIAPSDAPMEADPSANMQGGPGARAKDEEAAMKMDTRGGDLANGYGGGSGAGLAGLGAVAALASASPAPVTALAATPPAAPPPAATATSAPEPVMRARAHASAGSLGMAAVVGNASTNEEQGVDPYTGKMKEVKGRLAAHDTSGALAIASAWEASSPGDVLALVALGETSEATNDVSTASRAYGSILDLFPSRADLRRFAGERLEHIQGGAGLDLAIDTFDKARRDRPDHPESHRLAAYARVRRGEYAAAFDILAAGAARHYPDGRFLGVDRILREDLGLVAAAWMKAEPSRRSEILSRLARAGGSIEDAPSIRFVLNWETDANDVDFHIDDALGGHAYYGSPHLPSGGDLYADVTTGYGPECFTVRAPRGMRAGPYKLRAHYYSRGPMGYGMGKLEIIDHDGHGGLKFEERPFVVMADHAFVNLGTVGGKDQNQK